MINEIFSYLVISLASMAEAIFFPIPPDVFLIYYTYLSPNNWITLATITTLSSTLGGFIGYKIGYVFHSKIANIVGKENIKSIQKMYKKYGNYAIFLAGFSPIPYKVFTLSSGILKYDFKEFILYSMISRGLRFYIVSYITARYGKEVIEFYLYDPKFIILSVIIGGVLALLTKKVVSYLNKRGE